MKNGQDAGTLKIKTGQEKCASSSKYMNRENIRRNGSKIFRSTTEEKE